MKILNPTDNSITVQIFGEEYTIGGNEIVEVPNEVGKYWITNLHQFLEIAVESPKEEKKEEKKAPKIIKKEAKK